MKKMIALLCTLTVLLVLTANKASAQESRTLILIPGNNVNSERVDIRRHPTTQEIVSAHLHINRHNVLLKNDMTEIIIKSEIVPEHYDFLVAENNGRFWIYGRLKGNVYQLFDGEGTPPMRTTLIATKTQKDAQIFITAANPGAFGNANWSF